MSAKRDRLFELLSPSAEALPSTSLNAKLSDGGAGARRVALGGAVAALSMLERADEYAEKRVQRARSKERAAAESALTTLHLTDCDPVRRPTPVAASKTAVRLRKAMRRKQYQPSAQVQLAHGVAQARWQRLESHDSLTVVAEVDTAFAKSALPSACLDAGTDADTHYVSAAVVFPGPRIISEKVYGDTGTLRRRSDQTVATLYGEALASTVIATAKRAFASAPAAEEVRILVVRRDPVRFQRKAALKLLYRGTFTRPMLERDWQTTTAAQAIASANDVLINDPGSRPLRPIRVKRGSKLAGLVQSLEAHHGI